MSFFSVGLWLPIESTSYCLLHLNFFTRQASESFSAFFDSVQEDLFVALEGRRRSISVEAERRVAKQLTASEDRLAKICSEICATGEVPMTSKPHTTIEVRALTPEANRFANLYVTYDRFLFSCAQFPYRGPEDVRRINHLKRDAFGTLKSTQRRLHIVRRQTFRAQ